MCSISPLVDHSTKILSTLTGIPGVRQVTEAFVRATFFNHFVGGDTAEGTLPLLYSFRRGNKGALLAYSVEVDPASADSHSGNGTVSKDDLPHKRIIKEMIHSIDVAANFEDSLNDGGRRTWVAVKLTALVPNAQALINLSSHIVQSRAIKPDSVPFPGCPRSSDLEAVLHPTASSSTSLTKEDINDLRELCEDLYRVCTHARQRGVKVIIDAEWSWYQPAIDAVALALMREFNTLNNSHSIVQPLIYTTYQAYLRRTPSHLALSLDDARKNNYALGVKLVRGAYHPYEFAAHKSKGSSMSISPDELPPVWSHKDETDKCYNHCAKMLLNAVHDDIYGQDNSNSRNTETSIDNGGPKNSDHSWSSWLKGYIYSNPVSRVAGSTPSSASDKKLPSIGILFGTHNWESAKLILDGLVQNGLAEPLPQEQRQEDGEVVVKVNPEAVERVAVAQLYGMSDDLTQYLVNRTRAATPFIIKYVPYGALEEVMPYLSRRALENKSVLGDGKATHERQRAGKEIWKRITGQS
ncbi:FAD-linked oxidoreductase [Macrolepiota fuliginosa MF-IS2]|uniref:Proline dehydrogenase n=1 Tax=Macrolepiota fuliginosa MF-IS2 TaxID=1400762 RepID=A0A9P5XBH3_9AGAR|nr:FAD-linked oxidoreductase [Macrolepiota fuliginosa MF-IS2]